MPTGGVELEKENLQEWFSAGVCAVGMGSKLISKPILEHKDYSTITTLATEALAIIAAIRNP
jgi:2-dehydro-3-deoxyphosphogluconate aldolase/(4S)-4-hydroxy-2-oxoglutarate aldolase